jgi:gliding motility-associated-like protein
MSFLSLKYKVFFLSTFLMLSLSTLLQGQGCVSTSIYPYEWPSHRNWFFAPNAWTGMVRNMSTGTNTSVGVVGTVAVTSYEGVSAASDDNGNLLFYTNGRKLWKNTGGSTTLLSSAILEGNEGSLANGSASQGVIIVRHPLDPTNYYIFTTSDANHAGSGLNYLKFNSSGSLVTGATRLGTYKPTEGIAATKHANGVDIWITVMESGSNNFNTYLLTCTGVVSTPVVSAVAPNVSGQKERGGVAFSYDGTKFAQAHPNFSPDGAKEVSLYDFNKSTGAITNARHISSTATTESPYDVIFSPNGNRIYVSEQNGAIKYYDISSGVASTISATYTSTGVSVAYSSMEIGPDGALYTTSGSSGGSLRKVTGDLNTGTSFSVANVSGTSGQASLGLPTMYLPPAEEPDIQEVGPYCLGDPAVDLSTTWLCSGLNAEDATNYPTEYAGTGITNTGTGIFNPTTAGVGTHRIIFTRCSVDDTIWITVNPKPTVTLADQNLCTGVSATFDAGSGFSTYAWSGNGSGSAQTTSGSADGTYTVIVSNSYGCKDTASATLSHYSCCPDTSLSNIPAQCSNGGTINLNSYKVTSESGTWSITSAPGGSTATISGSTFNVNTTAGGSYVVRFTLSTPVSGCASYAERTIVIYSKPNVTLSNTSICSGDAAATFDAGSGYSSYAWSGNGTGTSQTTSGTSAGTYTVIVTSSNGCKDTASATLTVNTKPNISLTNATICAGDAAASFDAGAGYTTYAWSGNGTGSSRTTSGTTAGTYTVIVTDANGCKDTASATLTVNAKPSVTLTNATICSGDAAATFDAGAGYTTYAWSGNGTGSSRTTTGTTAGTYTVIVTDANGCKDTASATLTVNSKPNISLTNATICSGDAAATFDAGAGYTTYAWSGNGTGSSRTTSGTTAGTYTVIVTDANGCKDTTSATLTVNAKPSVTLSNAVICDGDAAATFDAGAGFTTYAWSGNGTGSSRTTSGTTAGTYTVIVTDANGCKDTSSATLTVNAKPSVTLTNATICSGDAAATFDAGAGYTTYAWSGNGTGSSRTTTGTTAGTYTVIVTDANGCKDTSSATLTVNAKPNVSLTNAVICDGDAAATFDAGAGYTTYAWSGNGTGAAQTTSGTTSGTYTVIVTDANGCKDTASATLTVNAKPTITPASATICAGDAAVVFDAGAGYSAYEWSGPATGSSQTISATIAGTYQVIVTAGSGCKDTAAAVLTVNSKPSATLTSATICSGDAAATFDAGSGYTTYAWSGNGTGAAQTTSGTTAGTYTVIVTDANGCKDTAVAVLTVNAKPSVTLTNATICSGDAAATFDAGAGYTTYAWSGNGTGAAQTTSGTTAGTYTVIVTDATGCKDTSSATLTVYAKPSVTLTNATICSGDAAATFDAGAGYTTYAWSGNGTGSAQTTTGTTAGTYTVIVTDANGCKDTATAVLTVNAKPSVALTNAAICDGDAAATFDAGAGYTTYAWSGNGTGSAQTTSGTTAGTYTVIVTDANGCKDTASATLTVNAKPTITPASATICAGDAAVVFDAGAGYSAYEWSGSATGSSQTISATIAGTYQVIVTAGSGCKDTAAAVLTVNSKPSATLTNATICSGDAAATFDAGAGYTTYAWSANGTGSSQTTSGTTAGTYTVIVTDANGCKDTASAILTVNAKPSVTLTNATICAGDAAATFDAGVGYTTYAWSGNGTGAAQTTSGTTAGTYTVIVTDANGCKDTASATLTVNSKPNISLTNATICSGDAAATFDAGAGYTTYAWSGNGTGSLQTTSGTSAGTYTVIVTDANGCKDTSSATLTVNAKPSVTLSNATICDGDAAATFDAGAGYTTYAWSGNGTGSAQTTSGTTSGTYTVIVTDANGCADTAAAVLTVNAKPNVTVANATICDGDAAATFDAGAGYNTYAWSGNGTGSAQTTTGTSAGTYTVIVTDANGCKDTASATLTVNSKPNISLTNATICSGDAVATFDAGAGYTTYLWSDNGTGAAQTTSGTSAGTYTAIVTDANGCKDTASATLTVNAKPSVTLTNAVICDGDAAATFDAGTGYTTYAWSGIGTGSSQTTSGTTAGTYTVIVTDVNGCKDTASATLTVNATPSITPPSATICAGEIATFDAGSGYASYEWNGPKTGSSQTISASVAGTYQVIVTTGSGCKDTATAVLTVNAKPSVTLTNATICGGDAAATFDAGAGYTTYLWSDNGTGSSQTTSGTAAGTYTVIVTDANGCKDTASATLTVNAKPSVSLTNATICDGDAAATFDAGAGYTTYLWSDNGTGSAQTTSGTSAGTYTVIVTDANGCKDTSSATLTVNAKPSVTLINATICEGDAAATFDAGSGYTTYAWSGNGTGAAQTTSGTTAGLYTVIVSDANGCKDTTSATLTVNAKPSVTLTNATICDGDAAATFDAGSGFTTYAWSGNGTGSSQTTSGTTAGTYTVIVTDANGCKDTAAATLTVNAKPSVTLTNAVICDGDAAATFDAGAGYTTYAWSDNGTGSVQTTSGTAAGTYTVIVTDANGCMDTANASLTINAKPNVSLSNVTMCLGDPAAIFDAGAGYTTYAWSDNGTGAAQTTSGTTAGTYTVIVSDGNGCKDTASATLTVNTSLNIVINDETICDGESATFDAGPGFASYEWSGPATGTTRTISATTAGTYTVIVASVSGCRDTASATLTVNPLPTISLSGDTNICPGETAIITATLTGTAPYTINASLGAMSFTFNTSVNTAVLPLALPGTYIMEVTDANGCKTSKTLTIIMNTKPNVVLTDVTICEGDAAATFDAGAGYASYVWVDNGTGTSQTTSGTTSGNYTVQVTDANGCKDTAMAVLTVNAKPNVTLNNATICEGDAAATFDAGTAYTSYVWVDNGTGTSSTTSGTSAGNYTVQVTDANGCKDTATAVLTVNAKPNVTLNNATICEGDAAATFDAGGDYDSYTWSDNGTGTSRTTTGYVAGIYTVRVVDSYGCKDTASATLTVNTKPAVTLTNATICAGDAAVIFDAGTGYSSYEWTANGTGSSQTTSGTTAGSYTVAVVDANGCKDTASAILTVNALPIVNLGADVEVCYGSPASIFNAANPGSSYLWSNASTSQSISTTTAGKYSVEVTNSNGCKGRDTVELIVNNLPVVDLGADRSICPGSSTTFDAGAGYAFYLWNDNSMNQTFVANTAGDYLVTVIDDKGCSDSDTAKVIVSTNLTVNLGADKEICLGSPAVTFDAGNTGATFIWSDGSTNQTLSTASAGTYWVSVVDANGCAGEDTVSLAINPLPIVSLNNASICEGSTGAEFTPGAYASYLWSTGETTASVSKTEAGIYTVTVSDANGCKDSASATLTLNALPVVDLGADRSICPGTSTTFDAGSFTSYLWEDNSTAQTKTVSSASTISVEVTDANGCKARDTAEVTVKSSLTVNLGDDKAICLGDAPVTFDAVLPGMNYVWSNGETTQTITTSSAGTYIVTVDDGSGCSGKDTVELVVNALPLVDLGADKSICLGDPMVTFDAGAGYASYGWSNNSAVRNITVGGAGLYSVEVIDINGCIAKDTVELIVNNLPVVDLGADRNICPGMTTTFDAGSFATYAWNNNTSNQTNTVSTQGNVIVNVADANGCKDADTAYVSISNSLTIQLGDDKEICFGDAAVTFDAGIAGATYSWNSGDTTQTISTNVAGSYAVTVTTPDGCTGTDVVTLTVNALPTVNIANQTICAGDTATFNAGTFAAYSWLSGENTASITKTTAGTYTVEVTDAKGCKNTASASLSVNALPTVTLSNQDVCVGSSATFDAGAGFSSYLWSSGESSQTISKSAAGTYTVTVSDVNNCKASASAVLTNNPLPAVTLAPFTPKCLNDAPFIMSGGLPVGGEYKTIYNSALTVVSTFDNKLMGAGTHSITYEYTDSKGCKNAAFSSVVVNNLPSLNLADKTVCAGESATFDAGAGFSTYYWNTAANTRTMTTSTGGDYIVNVSNAQGCKTSDTVKLIVNANPQVDLGADKKACEGSNFTLTSNVTASSYLWNNNATTNSITVNNSGKYSLTVTDENGCKGSDDVQVNIIARPLLDLGADKQICAGSSVILNTNLDASSSVYWSTGAKDKAITVNSTGAYMVQAYFDPTCPSFDTINVIVVPMPVSTLGNDTTVCFNEAGALTLDAGTADQFSWNDKAQSSTSSIDVQEEGTYIVQLTNANLCSVKDTININQICVTSLYIPNAFTPNGDATNDVFYVKGLNVEKFHLMIFNRWGELIFESYDINNGWDGTYMGNEVQIDVYVWKLDWLSTNAQEQKTKNERTGTVSLIR